LRDGALQRHLDGGAGEMSRQGFNMMESWTVYTDDAASIEQSEQAALARADTEHRLGKHVFSVNNPDGTIAYTRKQLEVRFARLAVL
jgi:hypothetical protein